MSGGGVPYQLVLWRRELSQEPDSDEARLIGRFQPMVHGAIGDLQTEQ